MAVTDETPFVENESRRLRDLYAKCAYFQGKLAQNQHYHAEAHELFELARDIWLMIGDVEAMSALFLEFMNAYQASAKGLADIDRYAPPDWRRTLAPALEKSANAMRAAHDYDRYATMVHNRAFVLQTMANELIEKGQPAQGRALLRQALSEYNLGFHYRIRLRDPRGIAQSRVRICECELPLAAALLDVGKQPAARKKLVVVHDHVAAVEEFYKLIPHEQLRHDDLDRVKREVRKLRARAEA